MFCANYHDLMHYIGAGQRRNRVRTSRERVPYHTRWQHTGSWRACELSHGDDVDAPLMDESVSICDDGTSKLNEHL